MNLLDFYEEMKLNGSWSSRSACSYADGLSFWGMVKWQREQLRKERNLPLVTKRKYRGDESMKTCWLLQGDRFIIEGKTYFLATIPCAGIGLGWGTYTLVEKSKVVPMTIHAYAILNGYDRKYYEDYCEFFSIPNEGPKALDAAELVALGVLP